MNRIFLIITYFFFSGIILPHPLAATMTRPILDQEIKDNAARFQDYFLGKLEALLIQGQSDPNTATNNLTSFVSALEDASPQNLAIAQDVISKIAGVKAETPESNALLMNYPELHTLRESFLDGDLQGVAGRFINRLTQLSKYAQGKAAQAQANQLRTATKEEFASLPQSDLTSDYERLTVRDFMQSLDGAACVLYSFLWAVKETPALKDAFIKDVLPNIKKDAQGNYYILVNDHVFKFDPKALETRNKELHPSSNPLIEIIGFYTLEKMGLINPPSYHLSDPPTGRDYFFDNKTVSVGTDIQVEAALPDANNFQLKPNMTLLKNNGSLAFQDTEGKTHSITGNFVLAVGIPNHGISFFYDTKTNKWKKFDNIHGVDDNPKPLTARVDFVQVIGDFKLTADK